jgi:transcriptional regulator with XRE-family HTH domain
MKAQTRDIEGTSLSVSLPAAYGAFVAQPTETQVPNAELVALREEAGLSQQDLADELNDLAQRRFGRTVELTTKTIGRWERGEVVWPQPFHRRLLAEYFQVAVDELGFRRPRPSSTGLQHRISSPDELLPLVATAGQQDPRVEKEQQQWCHSRQALGAHRRALAVLAEQLYPDHRLPGAEQTGVITQPSWIPDEPLPLGQIVLDHIDEEATPAVTGTERATMKVRPLASAEQRFRRYSHALRDLAQPTLLENRLCFRLLDVNWSQPALQLSFGVMGFFDAIDTNEALAHETALDSLVRDRHGEIAPVKPSWRRLPFRKAIGDPFDLTRRPLMGAIGTLTIRGGESPSVVLHHRDGARVAGGGSMLHLLPAGIFQPSSVMPDSVARDFSLWRNIQREYAEELLGYEEFDGTGRPIDYDTEPFATMDAALADGRLRVYCLGITLDALTLAGDILTVVIIEPELYDDLFGGAVDINSEGAIPTRAVPFEEHTLTRLREANCLAPGAAAALQLAWQHRRRLLA